MGLEVTPLVDRLNQVQDTCGLELGIQPGVLGWVQKPVSAPGGRQEIEMGKDWQLFLLADEGHHE